MMQVDGVVTTTHRNPSCIARALHVDNLSAMETSATASGVTTTIAGEKLRSVIASADDYLMNLSIAEEACRYRKGSTVKRAVADNRKDTRIQRKERKVR